ncbi:GAF domain-containing protein [Microscilla marina]|uniref:histidine kinase n=1 Tax=Microscilla marina ATCC 23134 TaxID=313606 RepID=A1ZW87_MICM2|nr:GAF domain-containing protein [Microscilla marina]EAY25325.1 hamp domain protein [Microscilla marina ATCC 23134]
MQLQSIKSKLLLSFAGFVLLVASIIATFLWSQYRNQRITKVTQAVADINLLAKDIHLLEKDFFHFDVTNPVFFKTGKSQFVDAHLTDVNKLKQKFQDLHQIKEIQSTLLNKEIDEIIGLIDASEKAFEEAVKKVRKKGFEDYGLIGDMRQHIHQIEAATQRYNLDFAKLLMIRRYEKDFLLRKDTVYQQKVKRAVKEFREDIATKIFNPATKDSVNQLLTHYEQLFNEVVTLDQELGQESKQGHKHELAGIMKKLSDNIQKISQELVTVSARMAGKIRMSLLSITLVFLVFIIILMYVIIARLGRPIQQLSQSINWVIAHNFEEDIEIAAINSKDEIGKLSHDFQLMLDKVRERTDEVTRQYENIRLLTDIGKEITSNLLIEQIVEVVHSNINPLLDAPILSIGVFDEDAQKLDFIGKHEAKIVLGYDSLDDDTKLSVWCFQNKEVVFINDFTEEASRYVNGVSLSEGYDKEPESAIYIPLIVKEQVVGVITAKSYRKNAYTDYHLNIMQNFAVYTAIALYNARVYLHIERQNQHLKMSEERIRQTAEELKTANEELENKRTELIGQVSATKRTLAVAEFDPQGNIIEANTLFLNELGYERADLLGKHYTVLLNETTPKSEKYTQLWAKLLQGTPQKSRLEYCTRFNKTITLNSTYTPVLDHNQQLKKIIKLSTLVELPVAHYHSPAHS